MYTSSLKSKYCRDTQTYSPIYGASEVFRDLYSPIYGASEVFRDLYF